MRGWKESIYDKDTLHMYLQRHFVFSGSHKEYLPDVCSMCMSTLFCSSNQNITLSAMTTGVAKRDRMGQ